jgi:hypothetical protein
MTDANAFDDDLFVSPRIREQRRTGVIEPLDVIGLCGLAEDALGTRCLGIEVTPETVLERVKLKSNEAWDGAITHSRAMRIFERQRPMSGSKSSAGRFEELYGSGSVFRERMSKIKELIVAYEMDMPFFAVDLKLHASPL